MSKKHTGKFLLGAALGAGLGLLFAPKKGSETRADLKVQFPYAKEICTLLGIKYIECDNYEADDIIGTFARMAYEDKEYDATIISSDKDLLQLISDDVNVKLLKQKDYILMNEQTFFETYNIKPIRMIDLKSLMGDPSDNIPGVKGIGEKIAEKIIAAFKHNLREIENEENLLKAGISHAKSALIIKKITMKINKYYT